MSELEKRKVEHVKIVAQNDEMDRRKFYFDEIRRFAFICAEAVLCGELFLMAACCKLERKKA